jgi:hypothetical protein
MKIADFVRQFTLTAASRFIEPKGAALPWVQ